MRAVIVGTKHPCYEKECPHWRGQGEALDEMGIENELFDMRHDSDFVQKIIDFKPDLVVYGLGDIIRSPEPRERIREELPGARIVFWYGDYRDERTGGVMTGDCSKTIDAMFVSNAGQGEFWLKKLGLYGHFLPLSCYKVKKRKRVPRLRYKAIFIGSAVANPEIFYQRTRMMTELSRKGVVWINGASPEEKAEIYRAMPELYGSAEVSLDISHIWDVPGYTSNRGWIIPMCWGLSLTKRFADCEELYPRGTKVYFDTAEEALEKIDYYSRHKKEGNRIREAGHKHTMENHTYVHRFKEMFKVLGI